MIGLDTNILVRYITQDDAEQAAQATRLIEGRCTSTNPGRVAQVVLCELVWVLRRAYGYSKTQVLEVLEQVLMTAELVIQDEAVVFLALDAYREGPADFSDYLLALGNRAAGCETTYSFDKPLTAHPAATYPE